MGGRRDRQRRSFRRRFFRYLPARSAANGPATTVDSRDRVGGARGFGAARDQARGQRHRRFRRCLRYGLRHPAPRRSGQRRRLSHDRNDEKHRRQPRLLYFRFAWTELRRRHGVFVLVGRARSRLRRAAKRARAARHRRRRQFVAGAVFIPRLLPGVDVVANRPLPCVRRPRGRLRAIRGRGRRDSKAAARRACGRGSDPGAHPRHGRQFRRPHDGPVAAERSLAIGAARQRLRKGGDRSGRPRLHRSARHGNAGRRSDRGPALSAKRWAAAAPRRFRSARSKPISAISKPHPAWRG